MRSRWGGASFAGEPPSSDLRAGILCSLGSGGWQTGVLESVGQAGGEQAGFGRQMESPSAVWGQAGSSATRRRKKRIAGLVCFGLLPGSPSATGWASLRGSCGLPLDEKGRPPADDGTCVLRGNSCSDGLLQAGSNKPDGISCLTMRMVPDRFFRLLSNERRKERLVRCLETGWTFQVLTEKCVLRWRGAMRCASSTMRMRTVVVSGLVKFGWLRPCEPSDL